MITYFKFLDSNPDVLAVGRQPEGWAVAARSTAAATLLKISAILAHGTDGTRPAGLLLRSLILSYYIGMYICVYAYIYQIKGFLKDGSLTATQVVHDDVVEREVRP